MSAFRTRCVSGGQTASWEESRAALIGNGGATVASRSAILRSCSLRRTIDEVQSEPIIYREEVTAILFALADINVKLSRIVRVLEDDDGQEEEDEDES